jgi:hypothetical protein
MVLLISYDLVGAERPSSYAAVKNYIEKHADSSRRPLYSQWFVETGYSPRAWVDALRKNELVDAMTGCSFVELSGPTRDSCQPRIGNG